MAIIVKQLTVIKPVSGLFTFVEFIVVMQRNNKLTDDFYNYKISQDNSFSSQN